MNIFAYLEETRLQIVLFKKNVECRYKTDIFCLFELVLKKKIEKRNKITNCYKRESSLLRNELEEIFINLFFKYD